MDLHKPKPWHGAREFLKEYAIIVVGVLTALGAEQTVESLHNHAELEEARAALRGEVTYNVANLDFAAQEDRCFLAGMARYAAWAKGGPKPPPIIEAVHFPSFATTVWDEVKSGAVVRMPLKERLAYASFYANGENQLGLIASERQLAGQISLLAVADTLDAEDAKQLVRQATAPRTFMRIKIGQDEAMLKQARDLGVRPKPHTPQGRAMLETLCGMAGAPVAD